jgi:colanic acid biosynthesis glycosyl transferase WcaI
MMRELALALIADGWEVTVLTGFPNHPGGTVFGGYKKSLFREEYIDGIRVLRVWLMTSPRRTALRRILTFLSFTITSSVAMLAQPRMDIVFAVLQPLTVGLSLPIVTRLKRSRLVFNVQDLHPDAPIELGLIKNRYVIGVLRRIERIAYSSANGIAVISKGFREHCLRKGGRSDSVAVIENWIDQNEIKPGQRDNGFRRQLGISSDCFLALYSGTIGLVSGAQVLVEAAKQLRDDPRIKIAFVGDGPLVSKLKDQVTGAGLDNVIFAPFQARAILSEVQAAADVSVVTLLPGKGRTSIPSKVLGYMAAARPVIASVDADSETAELVRTSNGGIVVHPGSADELAAAIRRLNSKPGLVQSLGGNGRSYMEVHLSQQIVTAKYIDFFRAIVSGNSSCDRDVEMTKETL